MILKMLTALVLSAALTRVGIASEAVSRHGGRVVDAGEYHVEMVVKGDVIDVHLTDHHNKAIRSTGHKGLAILVNGASQRIVLTPAGDSSLSGKADRALANSPKGVVQITLPSGKTLQARFN